MSPRNNSPSKNLPRRCGSIYVAVLGVAMMVSILAMAAMHLARVELQDSVSVAENARARLAAEVGVECTLKALANDPNWRTNHNSGENFSFLPAISTLQGTGQFTSALIDSDGNLADSTQDSVTVRAVGTAGSARSVVEVLLQPKGIGLDSLASSLHAGGGLTVSNTLSTDQQVSANGNILVSSSTIVGNAKATGTITGTVTGTTSPNTTPAWQMPDPAGVFEYYTANGTAISYSSIAGGIIENVVLSPAHNPYGTGVTNTQGIYVIDCQGNTIKIQECRIVGTLVLLNPGVGSIIAMKVHWEAAIANYPALLVQGNFQFDGNFTISLSEATLLVNFNPPGTPYNSVSDSDTLDSYSAEIVGLVYATGNLQFTKQTTIRGVVVAGGTVSVAAQTTLSLDTTFYNSPPPGFSTGGQVGIVPGTWRRVAY